jgi:predicted MFS family arabinose efflux permease
MGIWATWYPVGSTLGYRITHPVTDAFGGWSGIWWVGAALAAAGFILYALIVRQPRDGEGSHGHGASGVPFKEGIKNFQIWMLGLAFFFMMMGSLGFLTWTPHYLHEAFELPQKVANNYASFGFMLSAPGGIIAGIVISKLMSKRNAIIVTLAVLSALIYPFAFIVPQSVIVLFLSTVGFVTGFLCATVFAVVPKVMGSYSLAGLGMGVIIFMQSWANLLATPVMGYIIGDGHYEKAVVPTAIVQILGLVAAIAFAKGKATSSPETHPSH